MKYNNISKDSIESGFIEYFFEDYILNRNYDFLEKENLKLLMCTSKKEKNKISKKILKKYESEIEKLGYDTLVLNFTYNDNKVFFIEFLKSSISSFLPISDYLIDNNLKFENINISSIPIEIRPKSIEINKIFESESYLFKDLIYFFAQFEDLKKWCFESEYFDKFYQYSKPFEILFDVSKLFVLLKRVIYLKKFIEIKTEYNYLELNFINEMLTEDVINSFSDKFTSINESFNIQSFNKTENLDNNIKVFVSNSLKNYLRVLDLYFSNSDVFLDNLNLYDMSYKSKIDKLNSKINEFKELSFKTIIDEFKNLDEDKFLFYKASIIEIVNQIITTNKIKTKRTSSFLINILTYSKDIEFSNTTVINYAKLSLDLKPHLNSEIIESDLRLKIKKHFAFFIDICPRKGKEIMIEEDYNKLIDWTIYFYENKFEVPIIDREIKLRTNKTYVISAFKILFKQLNPSTEYPENLFKFYRSISNKYSEDKLSNFLKTKNTDEVYKLMRI